MAGQYGNLATSAFPVAPTNLDSANNVFRYRPKPGRTPRLEYVPVATAANSTNDNWLKHDFLTISSGTTEGDQTATNYVERAHPPSGAAGFNGTGDGNPVVYYMAAADFTHDTDGGGTVTVPVYSVFDLQFLFRLYHSTAATAGPDNSEVKLLPSIPIGATALNTDAYEWGLWEIGTSSTNYFPVVDVANLDTTNGGVKIVEFQESGATDNFAMCWVEFIGKG